MKKIYFVSLVVLLTVFASCQKDDENQVVNPNAQSGQVISDGYNYSFKNVVINPDIISIDQTNAEILSSSSELNEGLIKVSNVSFDASAKFVAGNILYVKSGNYTGVRKIEQVTVVDDTYSIQTSQAQLGEIIEEGSLDFSVDLYQAKEIAFNTVTRQKATSEFELQLVSLMGEYNLGNGFNFNPATDVRMLVHFSMNFKKGQILPKQVRSVFELQTNINPTLTFEGSLNNTWETDMVQFVPQALLDYIATLSYTVPINVLGHDLSASISVGDLAIPTTIETNFSNQSVLSYGLNGSVQLGYQLDISGLSIKKTPIFSNTLSLTNQSSAALYGEIITNTEIVVDPNISIIGGLFTSSGEISFGLRTVNMGNINLPGSQFNYGSKGTETSKVNINILGLTSVNMINTEQVLWNVGSFDNILMFKDLTWKKKESFLLGKQDYTFTLGYQYAILGKQLPSTNLTISYKVLSNDKKSTNATVTDKKITAKNLTNNNFQLDLEMKFKHISFLKGYETTCYITDIVITDANGYKYEGIYDTQTGTILKEIKITR